MKTKKIAAVILSVLMLITAVSCAKKEESMTEEEIQNAMNELYAEENELFGTHAEQWEVVFANMDKESVMNNTDDYATFLGKSIDACQSLFTADDLAILKEDVEKIREIEEQISELSEKTASASDSSSVSMTAFPSFVGKDFDGNDVDSGIFAENSVTVINFWFNGCSPCVNELGDLNALNESLKERGGELIGINVEAFDGNESIITEAKSILASKNASYRNIYFDSNSEAGQYAAQIMAFPTTVFVDRQGNIIGDPIVGSINDDEGMKKVNERIDEIIAADEVSANATVISGYVEG